jgi:hypothetical protein
VGARAEALATAEAVCTNGGSSVLYSSRCGSCGCVVVRLVLKGVGDRAVGRVSLLSVQLWGGTQVTDLPRVKCILFCLVV